jgi:hypothetical protein
MPSMQEEMVERALEAQLMSWRKRRRCRGSSNSPLCCTLSYIPCTTNNTLKILKNNAYHATPNYTTHSEASGEEPIYSANFEASFRDCISNTQYTSNNQNKITTTSCQHTTVIHANQISNARLLRSLRSLRLLRMVLGNPISKSTILMHTYQNLHINHNHPPHLLAMQ